MDREQAARAIQRAWSVYRGHLMDEYIAEQEARYNEVSMSEMYPERPVDWEGIAEVETFYRDLYTGGSEW
jgi:hypothetical protein